MCRNGSPLCSGNPFRPTTAPPAHAGCHPAPRRPVRDMDRTSEDRLTPLNPFGLRLFSGPRSPRAHPCRFWRDALPSRGTGPLRGRAGEKRDAGPRGGSRRPTGLPEQDPDRTIAARLAGLHGLRGIPRTSSSSRSQTGRRSPVHRACRAAADGLVAPCLSAEIALEYEEVFAAHMGRPADGDTFGECAVVDGAARVVAATKPTP